MAWRLVSRKRVRPPRAAFSRTTTLEMSTAPILKLTYDLSLPSILTAPCQYSRQDELALAVAGTSANDQLISLEHALTRAREWMNEHMTAWKDVVKEAGLEKVEKLKKGNKDSEEDGEDGDEDEDEQDV